MGQPNELLSFRKRLKNAGYFDIHIKKDGCTGYWIISACEPLGGYRITLRQKGVNNLFRKKLRGCGYVYQPPAKDFTKEFTIQ